MIYLMMNKESIFNARKQNMFEKKQITLFVFIFTVEK